MVDVAIYTAIPTLPRTGESTTYVTPQNTSKAIALSNCSIAAIAGKNYAGVYNIFTSLFGADSMLTYCVLPQRSLK